MQKLLYLIIPPISTVVQLIGSAVIIYGVVRSLYRFVKRGLNLNSKDVKLDLAQAIAYGLEFKLAGEILNTLIIQTIDEFIILAAIVVLRIILTFVIHWEIKISEDEEDELKYRREKRYE